LLIDPFGVSLGTKIGKCVHHLVSGEPTVTQKIVSTTAHHYGFKACYLQRLHHYSFQLGKRQIGLPDNQRSLTFHTPREKIPPKAQAPILIAELMEIGAGLSIPNAILRVAQEIMPMRECLVKPCSFEG
jgi:hypothetical protein